MIQELTFDKTLLSPDHADAIAAVLSAPLPATYKDKAAMLLTIWQLEKQLGGNLQGEDVDESGHDVGLHERSDPLDSDMTYCPQCHSLVLLRRLRTQLRAG